MCGCSDNCAPIRCRGAAGTDWSAFTWYWQSPEAAETNYNTNTIGRKFFGQNRAMIHPGVCNCLWLIGGNDKGRDLIGNMNTVGQYYAIPAIGALQYLHSGSQSLWQLTLTRWLYGYAWTPVDDQFGLGWGWDEAFLENDCEGAFGGWGGWAGYGWNGYGWGYAGLGPGWGYYGWGGYWGVAIEQQVYRLAAGVSLNSSGGVNRFLPVTNDTKWPAFVDITRIPKNGVP